MTEESQRNELLKIDFDFTMEDWISFQRYQLKTSKQFQKVKIFSILAFPFLSFVLILFDLSMDRINIPFIIFVLIGALLWIIFTPKLLVIRTLKRAKKIIDEGDNSGILGHHVMIFEKSNIIHIEPESEHKILWSGIKKLGENDTHYFLYNTAVSAIVIPKQKILSNQNEVDRILKKYITNKE